MIYLDHAATTPLPHAVAEAMYDVLANDFANPSAQYPAGVAMKKKVEGWRAAIAAAIPCQPRQLHFTSCGTESIFPLIMSSTENLPARLMGL